VDLEKTLLRKVGEAIHRFRMIRDGDRIAVAVSGGKDSVTLLESLVLLQKRAPIDFSVCAFTVEQGKFLRPIEPIGEYIRSLGVEWTYHTDNPSIRLITEQPNHGCDSLFRNIMFTGRLGSLPPVTYSREKDFRLIRPLVYVTEEITRGYVESKGVPVVPCGCSLRTGTVRRSIRETIADWEIEHPHLRENILSAMGNIQLGRLLDTRHHDVEEPLAEEELTVGGSELLPVLHDA
jgi:tRNA 2-thiocytidine biosynthesis protein TtcA